MRVPIGGAAAGEGEEILDRVPVGDGLSRSIGRLSLPLLGRNFALARSLTLALNLRFGYHPSKVIEHLT